MMECPWQQQDGGKNELTQNWWVLSRELGLWSSPAKLAAVGQARLRVSCVCWSSQGKARTPDPSEASGVRLASRWAAILSCAAARSFACSLLNIRGGSGVDGDIPLSHEVMHEWRHGSLGGPD